MRTKAEIKAVLQFNREWFERLENKIGSDPELLAIAETWVDAMEWILEGENEYSLTEEEFLSTIIQKAREAPLISHEQLIQNMKDRLREPHPFFKYLKEKDEEKDSLEKEFPLFTHRIPEVST